MAIDFPNSPTLNQDYTVGTTTWTYDGAKWILKTYNSLHAVPVTAMMLWANTTYPTGWLLADGSAISRTTYADLFAAIGTTYGVGDGSTTFNIPSLPSAGSGSPNTIIKVTNSGALEPSAISHAANHTEGGSDVVTITGNQITGYQSPRNNIINGAFSVDQRNAGASQTFTAAGALAYSVDRWYGYCTGANVTGARVAGAAPFQYYYRFTGAASNTAVGFGTRLEAADTYHLSGQTCRLSAYLASSTLTTVTWTAYYATTADSFGTLASPTRTSIATGTFTITSSVTRYTASVSVPTAATTGIEIVFTTGALVAAATLTFGGVQLEKGSVATPFEFEPFEATLRKCMRYYQVVDYFQGIAQSLTTIVVVVPAMLPMRSTITPSIRGTIWALSDNYAADATASSPTLPNISDTSSTGARVMLGGFTGLTVARYYNSRPSTTSLVGLSAEL